MCMSRHTLALALAEERPRTKRLSPSHACHKTCARRRPPRLTLPRSIWRGGGKMAEGRPPLEGVPAQSQLTRARCRWAAASRARATRRVAGDR